MYSLGAEIREKAEREGEDRRRGPKGKIERNISAAESFYGYC